MELAGRVLEGGEQSGRLDPERGSRSGRGEQVQMVRGGWRAEQRQKSKAEIKVTTTSGYDLAAWRWQG